MSLLVAEIGAGDIGGFYAGVRNDEDLRVDLVTSQEKKCGAEKDSESFHGEYSLGFH